MSCLTAETSRGTSASDLQINLRASGKGYLISCYCQLIEEIYALFELKGSLTSLVSRSDGRKILFCISGMEVMLEHSERSGLVIGMYDRVREIELRRIESSLPSG